MNIRTNLCEIFSSVQGEGIHVGNRQIFIRFADCNLSCNYCDTDFAQTKYIKIEQNPGKQDFIEVSNPIDIDTLFYYIKNLNNPQNLHHSISITGGEPLLHSEFLKHFLTENFAKHKLKVYLETNGILCNEIPKVVKLLDYVAMDIKLPSVTGLQNEYWQEHKVFLGNLKGCCKSMVKPFVKIVVNKNTSDYDLNNVVWCMSASKSEFPLVIQPETNNRPTPEQLLSWQQKLLFHLNDVRIIPQTHKILGFI